MQLLEQTRKEIAVGSLLQKESMSYILMGRKCVRFLLIKKSKQ